MEAREASIESMWGRGGRGGGGSVGGVGPLEPAVALILSPVLVSKDVRPSPLSSTPEDGWMVLVVGSPPPPLLSDPLVTGALSPLPLLQLTPVSMSFLIWKWTCRILDRATTVSLLACQPVRYPALLVMSLRSRSRLASHLRSCRNLESLFLSSLIGVHMG